MSAPITVEKTTPLKRTGYPAWALILAFVVGSICTVAFVLACSDPIDQPSAPYSHSSYRST